MAPNKAATRKKFFTPAEANAALPLVRAIIQDITQLAGSLRERHERITRVRSNSRIKIGDSHEEELKSVEQEFERDQERMQEYEQELRNLGVELKDHDT